MSQHHNHHLTIHFHESHIPVRQGSKTTQIVNQRQEVLHSPSAVSVDAWRSRSCWDNGRRLARAVDQGRPAYSAAASQKYCPVGIVPPRRGDVCLVASVCDDERREHLFLPCCDGTTLISHRALVVGRWWPGSSGSSDVLPRGRCEAAQVEYFHPLLAACGTVVRDGSRRRGPQGPDSGPDGLSYQYSCRGVSGFSQCYLPVLVYF